jgi:hypothetical protein
MSEIWNASLRRIQQRFADLKTGGNSIHAVVTDRKTPQSGWPATKWQASFPATPENRANLRLKTHLSASFFGGALEGPMRVDWTTTPGTIVGEIWHRDIDVFGNTGAAVKLFEPIALDAWRAAETNSFVNDVFPYRLDYSGTAPTPESLWILLVFKLAWKEVQGSSLRARKFVREQTNIGFTVDLKTLEAMRKNPSLLPTGSQYAAWIPKAVPAPDFIYSEIEDFVEASINAIDILLIDGFRFAKAKPSGMPHKQPQVASVDSAASDPKPAISTSPKIDMGPFPATAIQKPSQPTVEKPKRKIWPPINAVISHPVVSGLLVVIIIFFI